MFSMSKKELVARLQVTADLDLSKFGDDMKSRKMLLLTSSGIISCSDISLRSYDDVLKESQETSSVNLLDLALTAPLPERIETEDDKKVFLYCVDVQFLPNPVETLSIFLLFALILRVFWIFSWEIF